MLLLQRGRVGVLLVLLATALSAILPLSRPIVEPVAAQALPPATSPVPAAASYSGVRLTYYTSGGTMYSGRQTFEGAAAAHLSWLPIGTRFTIDCLPGHTYTVLDTGLMPPQWVDVYVDSAATGRWLNSVCGDFVTLRVVDPLAAPPAVVPARSVDPALEAALGDAIRAHLARRGLTDPPPFAVQIGGRAGDWVKVTLVPQVPGVEPAAVYLRQAPDGWQVVAGPGNAFDPDWLRSLGVPEPLIVP